MNIHINARSELALIRAIRVTVFVLQAFQVFSVRAEIPAAFFAAIQAVETSGRTGAVIGDEGAALGPYQIHRSYWKDSHMSGRYEQCADEPYARKVVTAYLTRYAPDAVKNATSGSLETLARIHNGGPKGNQKPETLKYWQRVRRAAAGDLSTINSQPSTNFSPAMSPAITTKSVSCQLVCTGLIAHASRPLKRSGFSGGHFRNEKLTR